jgi:hypothetical protein
MNDAEHRVETRRWLRYAREDLESAETLLEHRVIVPRQLCWLSSFCQARRIACTTCAALSSASQISA